MPVEPAPAWKEILAGLRDPVPRASAIGALADLVATPLGLWLLRTSYVTPGTDPAPLLENRFAGSRALRAHLFDRLIPALIDTRPPSDDPAEMFRPRRRHDPAQVRRWLGYLAHQLTRTGSRDFAWWHLARTARTTRLPRLIAALAIGIAAVAATALEFSPEFGLAVGLVAALVGGVTIALVTWLRTASWNGNLPASPTCGFADASSSSYAFSERASRSASPSAWRSGSWPGPCSGSPAGSDSGSGSAWRAGSCGAWRPGPRLRPRTSGRARLWPAGVRTVP
ncbi:hypothetical protein ETD83_08150 [Actinomadura soli]|uniref:Uncharacterized protein n=1 Tax=Actinomadura soli TaxID=2508997 RepID=A0A5C4JGF9_9ACTN|nr:hypothetical protein [Actinomadura soli]TMR04746.1 hypothetical protein ETD83_08150 [Actinomadura soli]